MKFYTFLCTLLLLFTYSNPLNSQVNYTANDGVNAYNGDFGYGVNMGYHANWGNHDTLLANIAAGRPDLGIPGVGCRALRPAMPDWFVEQFGFNVRGYAFDHYDQIGMDDHAVFLEGPSDAHKSNEVFCNGVNGPEESILFKNMYLDIWDGGANGTPYNDNNYFARYVYNTVLTYKDHVQFWEIWNEPDFSYTSHPYDAPGTPGSWWDNDPDPCDMLIKAPIYHYIRLLRISYEVIKTVDPTAYITTGGLGFPSFLDAVMRNTDNPVDGSVTADYPLKGGAYFDVLSYHVYPHIEGCYRDFWDVSINNWQYERHSDAAADCILEKKQGFEDVLHAHGYDGSTYDEKLWIITEANIPRKGISNGAENYGNDEIQRNWIIKSLVLAQQNNIEQLHVFRLGETQDYNAATYEFALMGLYTNLDSTDPYTEVPTDEGRAYHTTADLLHGLDYDEAKTNAMNKPAGVRGGAFVDGAGNYTYVLWAECTTDQSEVASATYNFPAGFNISSLTKMEWNHADTNASSTVGPTNVALTGAPIFLQASASPSSCDVPSLLAPLVISGNVVKTSWAVAAGAERYRIQYKPLGGSWTELLTGADETFRFINGLSLNTSYEYRVKSLCATQNSVWSNVGTFTTLADVCDYPASTNVSSITSNSAVVTWSTSPNATKYRIKYRYAGASWIEVTQNPNTIALTGLAAGANYKYKLKTKCAVAWTNWKANSFFTTSSSLDNMESRLTETDIKLYPNPAHDVLNISSTMDLESIRVINMAGQEMMNRQNASQSNQLDISSIPNGIYLVSIITKNQEMITKKFVKE